MISTFSNGQQSAQAFAAFWQATLSYSGIDTLLFQDGIGVKKLSLTKLDRYFKVLQEKMNSSQHNLEAIVEIFQLPKKPSKEFMTEAANFSRIVDQLKVIKMYSQRPITVFSAPDHLLPNRDARSKTLHHAWLQERHDCQDLN
jgi:hypothetical protein